MEPVYLVQNFFLGSLVVWFLVWSGFFCLVFFFLVFVVYSSCTRSCWQKRCSKILPFLRILWSPSSLENAPWRAKVGRQSWFISHPHCRAWHQVLTWWTENGHALPHNAPVNMGRGLIFFHPVQGTKDEMALFLPQSASSTEPVKTTTFRTVVICLPL